MKISITGQGKRWPFNTGDCIIEVTTWTGMTVLIKLSRNYNIYYSTVNSLSNLMAMHKHCLFNSKEQFFLH